MREVAKDMISSLPDPLLHHIHSFLDIKHGARTSALSKRWNSIWTTVQTLHFQIPLNRFPTSSETDQFMDFVDGTLFRHESNVQRFFLRWDIDLNESRVRSWISFLVRGGVKELVLHLRQEHPLFIPLSLFTCESLVSLELQVGANIRFPRYISFPRLKRLKLYYFKFTDECWNEQLFSNSPVLEELIIKGCIVSVKSFCISIPTLKLLKINILSVEGHSLRDFVFRIVAPTLVTFSYSGYIPKEFVLSSFPALEEAALNFTYEKNAGEEATSRLLRALAHVKRLTVHAITLQAFCSSYHILKNFKRFPNVQVMNIEEVLTSDGELIISLKTVPKLVSLVFRDFMADKEEEDGSDNDDGNNDNADDEANHNNEDVSDAAECSKNYDNKDDGWTVDISAAGCLFPHLKSVCFEEFAGNPREIRWVKLILRSAKSLQTVSIRYSYDSEFRSVNAKGEIELMADIPRFPRASAGCVIKFYARNWKSWVGFR